MDMINEFIDINNNNIKINNTKNIHKLHLKRPPPDNSKDDFYLSKYNNNNKNKKSNQDNCFAF
jgi:hypothetical protein